MVYFKMRKILLLLMPLLCSAKNLTLESRINPPARELMDVEIVGDIMMIPGNLDGYDFYNISDPKNPTHLANIEVPMGNRALSGFWVAATEEIAYFSSRTKGNGSAIVNYSNPSNPIMIGSLSFAGSNVNNPSLEGLAVSNGQLAVAAHEDGVFIFNIDDPENPELSYERPCENAWDVAFIDLNHIVIGNGESGIILEEIYCESDSCSGASFETLGAVKDVEIRDSLLFIAEGSDGVSIYNVSDIDNPVFLDSYNTEGMTNKIAVFDTYKIAVSDWLGVKILEWTGESLELVGYKSTGKRTMAIAARDSMIYSAEWQHLQTFTFGDIEDADIDIGSWDIAYPALEIGESDTFNLVVENNGQFPLGFSTPFINHSDFNVLNFPEYLDIEETTLSQIVYTRSNQNASGVMQITSNDPDESVIEVQLVGNYDGGIVGVEAPDFSLPIVANGAGSFTLSNHQGQVVVLAFFAPG